MNLFLRLDSAFVAKTCDINRWQPQPMVLQRGRLLISVECHGARVPGKKKSKRESTPPAIVQNQIYRLFNVKVPFTGGDVDKDDYSIHATLLEAVQKRLSIKNGSALPLESLKLVRKSFDARKVNNKVWMYVVDVDGAALQAAGARKPSEQPGQVEILSATSSEIEKTAVNTNTMSGDGDGKQIIMKRDPVVVVGSGPAGLFAALEIAEAGLPVIVLERGQPVDVRGRDIGALMVRKKINAESNLCFGEGGAGTWSDGKLTTRIGRNEDPVRHVLQVLYELGAPESVLVSGKPHLGTDRLVRILKAFRERLISLKAEVRFGARVMELVVAQNGHVCGVKLADGSEIAASRVVLAVGHSARDIYTSLNSAGVAMTPKPFSMGFRIEHPQSLIDEIQYGLGDAEQHVLRGKGPIPVAEYRLTATINDEEQQQQQKQRGVYSFCMCPGGQIVPTSTDPELLCLNGMSFSKRNSKWANSALVSTVDAEEWAHLEERHGVLAGMELQKQVEREAARRGGSAFVAPVQRVVDFMAGHLSIQDTLPSSSYRLGIQPAALHDFYSPAMTAAIKMALERFEAQMPGFASSPLALLHAAETRTSAPVRIDRGGEDTQSISMPGLHPCGEGAGYAGGIMSSAVDGLRVGRVIAAELTGKSDLADAAAAYAIKGGY